MKKHTPNKMTAEVSQGYGGNLPLYFYLEIHYICMCKQ